MKRKRRSYLPGRMRIWPVSVVVSGYQPRTSVHCNREREQITPNDCLLSLHSCMDCFFYQDHACHFHASEINVSDTQTTTCLYAVIVYSCEIFSLISSRYMMCRQKNRPGSTNRKLLHAFVRPVETRIRTKKRGMLQVEAQLPGRRELCIGQALRTQHDVFNTSWPSLRAYLGVPVTILFPSALPVSCQKVRHVPEKPADPQGLSPDVFSPEHMSMHPVHFCW